MELEDPNLNNFLNEVCQYMASWHSYANVMGNFSLDKVCAEPYSDFKRQLKLFYRGLDPLHKSWFEVFFTPANFQRNIVEAVLNAHYFTLKTKSKSIFMCLLYVCSFTYSLLHYCEKNGMNGMLNQIRTFLKEAFASLQGRFNSEGGFDGLRKFNSTENLPTILQFIGNCYCEKAIFSTFIFVTPNVYDIGLHGREPLDLFLNNVQTFESSVREAFEREINVNLNYKQEVDYAFSKLRSDLETGPFQNILSNDRANLAADPTSPMSRI